MSNEQESRMYGETKTWNPFIGCKYNCEYCKPSFQAQMKRQKRRCLQCYDYIPHTHEKRLKTIPCAKIVFISGCGDISFCPPEYTSQIIERIRKYNRMCSQDKIYYFQSKNPRYFKQFLNTIPIMLFY